MDKLKEENLIKVKVNKRRHTFKNRKKLFANKSDAKSTYYFEEEEAMFNVYVLSPDYTSEDVLEFLFEEY